MKEVSERDKRRMNVVVMGVPEVDEENDKVVIDSVIKELVEEMHIECEVGGRIGKKSDKMRPLRVKLTELSDKRRILSRAKNLKNKIGMEKFYIVPDLTQEPQREDKRLRDEVKRLRDTGAVNVRISKGTVVADEQQ